MPVNLIRQFLAIFTALLLLLASHVCHAAFLQTFYIRVGGNALSSGDETTLAKYDKLMFQRFHYDDIGGDSWAAIQAINASCDIYVYQQGRSSDSDDDAKNIVNCNSLARYNVSRGHSDGSLNGDHSSPTGTGYAGYFLTDSSDVRLCNLNNAVAMVMDFGNSDMQDYWTEATITDIVGQAWEADGVWIDLTTIHPTTLATISAPAVAATSAKYTTRASWADAMNAFINAISLALQAQGQKIWCNRTLVNQDTGEAYDEWIDLDSVANPPDAALEEAGFACRFGIWDVQFYNETKWKRWVDLLKNISNYDVCIQTSTVLSPGESGLDNHGNSVTFWEVLWYGLGSYQLGKNTTDNNSYFSMYDSYNTVIWFDEYDAMNGGVLDLGAPSGAYSTEEVDGDTLYKRQFDYGWVYVNPTTTDMTGIAFASYGKVLNHNNFKDVHTAALVNFFDLPAHRAVIITYPVIASVSPADDDTGVSSMVDLTWSNPTGTNDVDVYFEDADPPTVKVLDDQDVETYDCGSLSYSTKYCYRVDVNHDGGTETGTVICFTTSAVPPSISGCIYEPDGATGTYEAEGVEIQ